MKSAESLLGALVLGLAGFIGVQTHGVPTSSRSEGTHARSEHVTTANRAGSLHSVHGATSAGADRSDAQGEAAGSIADASAAAKPIASRDANLSFIASGTIREMRRRVRDGGNGTYIDQLLLARDSSLSRWPNRDTRPLRIWVDEAPPLAGWTSDFVPAVRDAFDVWSATGIPVRFDFVIDSATADVHVRFVDRLQNGVSGRTTWSRDATWWLVSGDIQLALAHPGGGLVTPPQMRAIALHEVGHLLGLDHTSGAENIMSARVRVRDLTEADRATIRLLYSMPAGSIR